MKYPASHWQEVADYVRLGLTPEEIQNHYPHVTLATVKRWIRRCLNTGYL
jgi:uncharacterized protein (DUF433 family)